MPSKGTINSVKQNYNDDGLLTTERYYDNQGDPYLDIDYTNHCNSKTHPHVQHEHKKSVDTDDDLIRGKEEKIQ